MDLSENGLDFIEVEEGYRSVAYRLPGERYYTIAFGHYGPDVRAGEVVTRARGGQFLRGDVAACVRAINALLKQLGLKLSQGKFDALVSLLFNCGTGILAPGRSLGDALRSPGLQDVPAAFMVYSHDSTGGINPGLIARRKAEVEMWNRGQTLGPASWLTRAELKDVRHLDKLRKVTRPTRAQESEITLLVDRLTGMRERIWRLADPASKTNDGRGWDCEDRRRRWESLHARTF